MRKGAAGRAPECAPFPYSPRRRELARARRSLTQRPKTDNEQRLPSASEFADAIKPYLPDSGKILDSFVYLAPAERLTDIQDPAETRLGYIPTPPEGHVIVFADGHVKWKKTLE